MEVILLEGVRNLGKVGHKVNVKAGYARNFLVPYGKAVVATPGNLAEFEKRRAELEKAAAELLASAQKRAEGLAGLEIKLVRKASEDGKLFGSITVFDVLETLKGMGHDLDRRELVMPEQHIRSVGEYHVKIELHPDVVVDATVLVEAE